MSTATEDQRTAVVMCPRCKHPADATIGTPWKHPIDGMVEWVKVAPHLHGRTGRSTCKPKGYARRVRAGASSA